MSGPRPAHLARRGAVYVVRFRLPAELVRRIGLAEITRSLYTKDAHIARERCLAKEGKRTLNAGHTGALESIQIWAKGTKKTSAEQRAVIIYDKRKERLDTGAEPPFGPAPVTRVEVTKKRFGNKSLPLTHLGKLSNQLAGVVVGSLRAAGNPASLAFVRYVDARRAVGPIRAAANLSLPPETALRFEKWYSQHAADVMNGSKIWGDWASGLSMTGTALLIEAAQKKSKAVPPPDLNWG